MDVCYYSRVTGWKESCPAGSQGGVGSEGKWLLPVALLPKWSIDDKAQFKADGVIHTLKTAWGNVQNHVPECRRGFIPRGEEEEEAFTWMEMRVESWFWRAQKVLY